MPEEHVKVIVDKHIEVLAANGETILVLEPGRSKGTVIVFIDDGIEVLFRDLTSPPSGEKMLGPIELFVKTDPWEDWDEDDEDNDE